MCGLFGWIVGSDRCPGLDTLVRLTDLMAHRGPDGTGYELRHTRDNRFSIGLGHRRLSIIDATPGGAQPMWNAAGTKCLIFNGEIYNYVELRRELEARGRHFVSASDTEVLLAALDEWGKEAIGRFRGMFAFAVYDTRDDTILIARDPFGKKPLFVGTQGGDIFFASEIEPITRAPRFERTFNWRALEGYLLDRYVPGPETFFTGVTKLQPGCLMQWQAGRITVERYYNPPFATVVPDLTDYAEAVRLFDATLDDAVRVRMRSDAPFGAFLSGGLDSSALVAYMQRHASERVRTFSVGFEEQAYSELQYSRLVADRLDTDHSDVVVSARMFFDDWDDAILRRGAPVSEASDIPLMILSKAASSGVKMVLTGEGADELLAGYPKHMAERYAAAYQRLVPAAVHNVVLRPAVDRMPFGMHRIKVLMRALEQRNPADRFRFWFGGLSAQERDQLLGRKIAGTTGDAFPFSIAIGSNLRRSQFFDQTSWLPDNSLERADRMMMAGSIEGRMPFMDTELAALVARMPDNFLIRAARTKAVLRDAVADRIPRQILARRKIGFRVPIGAWFRGAYAHVVRDLLTSDRSSVRHMLNQAFIERMVDDHVEGRVNHERVLWSLCNLEQFLRVYKPELALTEMPIAS